MILSVHKKKEEKRKGKYLESILYQFPQKWISFSFFFFYYFSWFQLLFHLIWKDAYITSGSYRHEEQFQGS